MHEEILLELKGGSYPAFKTIYQQWKARVFYYFLSKTNEEDSAKELTQLTFIKLWEYRSSVDVSISAERQIFQKAKYIYIDYLRKLAHQRELYSDREEQQFSQEYYTPHRAYEEGQTLQLAIESLPKSRQQIFKLKYIQGYSYKEISEIMSISPKTVDNQLLKAVKHLRKILEAKVVTPVVVIISLFL